MEILEIVREYLKENGYDGLYQPGECACLIEDLMPCGQPTSDCEAGYKVPCEGGDDCPLEGNCDYHIGPEK